jgi:hypothetical protein
VFLPPGVLERETNTEDKYVEAAVEYFRTRVRFPPPPPLFKSCGRFCRH